MELRLILFTTTRWKFLTSKTSHKFPLTTTPSQMPHLDMVVMLSASPLHGMKELPHHGQFWVPAGEPLSVVKGWGVGRWGTERALFPFLRQEDGLRVKLNYHLTLGEIQKQPPNRVKCHYNFPCVYLYRKAKPFLLNIRSEVYISKNLNRGTSSKVLHMFLQIFCPYPLPNLLLSESFAPINDLPHTQVFFLFIIYLPH